MLDEALREFRRVADLRPTDASAPFYLGLIALRQARWDEARRRASSRRPAAPAPSRPRCTTSATRSSGSGGCDEAEAAYGDAAGRARDDARVMLGWSVVALKRGEHQVAQGAARARPGAAGRRSRRRRSGTGPRRSRARGSTTAPGALAGRARRASARIPANRGAPEQPRRRCSS